MARRGRHKWIGLMIRLVVCSSHRLTSILAKLRKNPTSNHFITRNLNNNIKIQQNLNIRGRKKSAPSSHGPIPTLKDLGKEIDQIHEQDPGLVDQAREEESKSCLNGWKIQFRATNRFQFINKLKILCRTLNNSNLWRNPTYTWTIPLSLLLKAKCQIIPSRGVISTKISNLETAISVQEKLTRMMFLLCMTRIHPGVDTQSCLRTILQLVFPVKVLMIRTTLQP